MTDIAHTTPFALKAYQGLLSISGQFGKQNKYSPIVLELANQILVKNLPAQQMEIRFDRGAERIDLRLSKDGEILKFAQSGKNKSIDYVRPQFQLSETPLAKYHWKSLNRPNELSGTDAKTAAFAAVSLWAVLVGDPVVLPFLGAIYLATNALERKDSPEIVKTAVLAGAALTAAPLVISTAAFAAGTVLSTAAFAADLIGSLAWSLSPIIGLSAAFAVLSSNIAKI